MRLASAICVIMAVVLCAQKGSCRKRFKRASLLHRNRQKAYPLLLSIVKAGGHRGLAECQKQFKNDIWNCALDQNKHVYKQLPIFVKTTLPYATRETAFLHAISTAAITHEVTLQCRQDKIPGCRCIEERNKQPKGNGDWQWGGCSDNIWFGENTTKSFIDGLEPQVDNARTAVNLHNNEVGRRVVRSSLKKECKCHGVTGSCHLKTCWKSLASFSVVGAALKRKYQQAAKVALVDSSLQEDPIKKSASRIYRKLVYLDPSPDYCVRNITAGSHGMLGRTCNTDDVSISKCKSLCNSCKLRSRTVEHRKQVDCKCKFVWCCSIECEKCTKTYSVTTCTRRQNTF